MLFELLSFFIGIGFGFFHKGKEDYTGILKNGIIVGTIVGIIAVLATMYLVPGGTSLSLSSLGAFGVVLEIIVFVIIIVIGAFLGDLIERTLRK